MALHREKEKYEETGAEDIVAGFIRNNRKALAAVLILAAAAVIGFIAFYAVKDTLGKKAIARVEEYARRAGELAAADDADAEPLLEELNAFAQKNFGYAAAKAYSLAAGIYADRKEWDAAEEAWLAARKKAPKIFLAPFSLYNAAVAAEEQGKLDEAAGHYARCVEYQGINPAAIRSQFAIGRIREQQNDREGALEAYRKVVQNWPSDSNWTNLAQSRIISLGK
jgi:tetratricopeptide (TPR) repeat protein